jgi:serine/threonine-protein kinase
VACVIRGVIHPAAVLSAPAITGSVSASTGRRYEPIAQIGRGGMAEVLLTLVDAGGGVRRLEVLKRIWPELATDPDFVTMFLDEARLSLRLNHPNVVQTHEVLIADGELAIAMEYLDGQPLTRILNRLLRGSTDLSLSLRLRILTRVLAGLEHAHTLTDIDGTALGVVHRDVSPQNVFVTYDGQVKLVDFGVAKTLAASHHTRPGAIKGKIAYMAPEQFQCGDIDRRADVFAVGVMLWEMLSARRMWHRMTEVEIVSHLASGRSMPPLPVPSDGSLPAGLDAICARALHIDPDRRYQTAADLEMELEGVLAGAADSHARNLGKVVSMAFAAERAERQAVIERCLRGHARQRAASASTGERAALPTIEVPVSDSDVVQATPVRQPPPKPDARPAVLWRRTAAAGGVLAALLIILLAADRRHQPNVDVNRPRGPVAAIAAPARPTIVVPPPDPQPPEARISQGRTPGEEAVRHRRHRRVLAEDQNATLPPSDSGGIDYRP